MTYAMNRGPQTGPGDDLIQVGIGWLTFRGVTADTLSVRQARLASCLVGPGGRLLRQVHLSKVAPVVYRKPDFNPAVARALKVIANRTWQHLDKAGMPLLIEASCADNVLRAYPQ
jgi:hypothetical protein